ncbi:MAG: hypothetical protein ACRYF3_15925, partial [Janthinobacterium lividum]
HVVLLLPLLAVWPRFGLRRTAVAVGGAVVLMAPWALGAPRDFLHDTVATMVQLPPLRFADTLYTAVLNETGVALPFAVVGVLILAVLVAAVLSLHRRPVGLSSLLTWCAGVLVVANLVNKQAFYNQFWLVGALLLLAVAASAGVGSSTSGSQEHESHLTTPGRRGRAERRHPRAGSRAAGPAPANPIDR